MFTKLQKAAQRHLSQLFSVAYMRQSRAAHPRRAPAQPGARRPVRRRKVLECYLATGSREQISANGLSLLNIPAKGINS
jgi:hypothetical protein